MPLDPALERVQRKLKRLVAISGAIMAAGLVAVFAAIFYRLAIADKPGETAAGPAELTLRLPTGAAILGASASGDRLTLIVADGDGERTLWIVSLEDGRVLQRVRFRREGE